MADIRCPNCGRNNPDILDFCQFCQTPLKPESVLRSGDRPTKKNTGELESILPDWLKDVRQQARDSAEADAAEAANRTRENEPPDLLAGLASQAKDAGDDEMPDWLARLSSPAKTESSRPSPSESKPDFFAQFNQSADKPASEPPHPEESSPEETSADTDELSAWFTQAAQKPEETIEFEPETPHLGETDWTSGFDSPLPPQKEQAPKEEEDLSWLRNLEQAAKQTGDLQAPKPSSEWMSSVEMPAAPSQPTGAGEDLRWLDSLGGIEEAQEPTFEQTDKPKEDLSWLDQFGGIQTPSSPTREELPSSQEDLSWMDKLGITPEPFQPPDDAAPEKPAASAPWASTEDLDWLRGLGGTTEPTEPMRELPSEPVDQPVSQKDLGWLDDLGKGAGAEPIFTPPFSEPEESVSPRQTAPLDKQEPPEQTEPDWLRSATEAPSMPPPGDVSMDWFQGASQPAQEKPVPSTPPPAPLEDLFSTPSEPVAASGSDVDSLFSMEMPDWLSQPEPARDDAPAPQNVIPPAEGPESLAPVDLPSWVQAMRPVEAMISETTPGGEEEPEETEGPLAGLRGVIPGAPIGIGSPRRPKPISLKLQATEEQQTGAALLEQILGSETSPRALAAPSLIASQQILRWALAGLFLLVLGAVIALRSQIMPVSSNLPVGASAVSNTVMNLSGGAKVLVVIDYEPSLTAEMEAIGGPVLDQVVVLKQPALSFVSTSPNGSALAERLLTSANLTGTQYLNLGYLPGGSAGVLGFLENPGAILPASGVGSLADYAAIILMTDHAEAGRVWVEQLQNRKQVDPLVTGQPLLVLASAQAGPLFRPYVSSGQVTGMISGLAEAARYELASDNRPGMARIYWDAFGIGLMMSVALIVIGSLWNLVRGIQARRLETEQR